MIDILISTYNGEKYLKEQILSILNQDFSDFNLIIRDDGSSDNTLSIINEFISIDERVKLLDDNLGNLGILKSFKELMLYSKSELIFFGDQDDIWLENKLSLFINKYKVIDNNLPILIHSNAYIVNGELKRKGLFIDKSAEKKGIENSLFKFYVQGASTMINSKLKELVLIHMHNAYIHDRLIHLVCELEGMRYFINQPTMLYRQHEANVIGVTSRLDKIKNVCSRYNFYLDEDYDLIKYLSKEYKDHKLINIYLKITDKKINKILRIYYLYKYNISMRFIDKIRFLIS